jgi:hypothetical protein
MKQSYQLINDPLFYIVLSFFALLTTALPAAMGQPRFLPVVQTLALFSFLFYALRRGHLPQTLRLLALWLLLQMLALLLLTLVVPGQVERAISNGFQQRSDYLLWFYGGAGLPDTWLTQPWRRLGEFLGILFGSLLTGGLVGLWVLVRTVNLAAFEMGALLQSKPSVWMFLAILQPWTLCRLAGYGGLVGLLAEPLLTSNWRPQFYLTIRRRPFVTSGSLLLLGLLLEVTLPSLWRLIFAPRM